MEVSKTVQGSPEGAWFLDAAEHLASLATKAEQAEQELAALLSTALVSAQEDLQAGRKVGPMLATAGKGRFVFYQAVLGSCQERLALTNHVGLIGQSVTNQIPLVEVDPNQHPMDQLRSILQAATRMKDDSARLRESLTKIVKTAQELSDTCHDLQVKTVVRTPGANHPSSEYAQPNTNEETMAMADRIKQESQKADIGMEQAAQEELDQAAPNSATSSPRTRMQQEIGAKVEPAAQPKVPDCLPQEEQPGSKRQKADPPEPKPPPKQVVAVEEPQEEEGGDQSPEAAKKARPTAPPAELRTKSQEDWLADSPHVRMRLPEDEDLTIIHISAPLLHYQVPKTFKCTKKPHCQQYCVHCESERMTQEMRQPLLYAGIPADVFGNSGKTMQ